MGHDEYWTMEQRDAIAAARDGGKHLAFFAANTGLEKVDLEPSSRGVPGRTLFAPKGRSHDGAPATGAHQFRNLGKPEYQLLGVEAGGAYHVSGNIVVTNTQTWVTANTGLQVGDSLPGLLGFEIDSWKEPIHASHVEVARSWPAFQDYAGPPERTPCVQTSGPPCQWGSMSVYRWDSGAEVFSTGSMKWVWGLDDWGSGSPYLRAPRPSDAAKQITRNVLNRFRGR